MTTENESSLYWEAVKAYVSAVEGNGYVYDQPSESLSEIGSKTVSLNNSNGKLATYNIKTKSVTLR